LKYKFDKMDIQTTKIELAQKLLSETRQSVLEQIKQLLASDEIVAYTTSGEPLTRTDYLSKLEEGRNDIDSGRTISTDELKNRVESWKEKYNK
jgi:chromosome condensin MukBEF complex kleisin-like MukF subunit